MTNQQKIGSAIIISVLILGIIFKFFNPIVAFIFLLAVACGIWAEAAKSQNPQTPPTIEDIRRKYPSRRSQEQIRGERLKRRQPAAQKRPDSPKYKKLLAMVGGNRATADRLVSAYGVDKAIADLERDRRIS